MLKKLKNARGTARFLMPIAAVLSVNTGTLSVAAQTFDEAVAAYHRGDYATALHGFRIHAEQGNARAQFYMGFMYSYGQGVRGGWTEAARWYHLAGEQGDTCARLQLGFAYEMSAGVRQDGSEAVRWYRLAAESGVADAQERLASLYYSGRLIPRDYDEAVRWYRAAAEQDNTHALGMLGNMYRDGKGVRQNYAEAVKWYRLGAELGDGSAQYQLGLLYASGKGVGKDLVQAHKWANLAASWTPSPEQWWTFAPTEMAAAHRAGLEKRMTSAELAKAQRLAREWRPRRPTVHQRCKLRAIVQDRPHPTPGLQHEADPNTKRAKSEAESAGPRIANVQRALRRLGYDPGPIDGILGSRTRMAIRSFQVDHGLPITGRMSEGLESAVLAAIVANETPPGSKPNSASLPVERKSTGSGFRVSADGHILTNAHVVHGCAEIRIPPAVLVRVAAREQSSDLALLRAPAEAALTFARFRQGRGIRPGADIVVVGYPLRGVIASEASVSTGTVSALAGPGDDRRLIQISAPVQPGNSGGPVLDLAGNVIGVVVGKLDALEIARSTGDIPQNVNFAIGSGTARSFLDATGVLYETAPSDTELGPVEVAAAARGFTVVVECWM